MMYGDDINGRKNGAGSPFLKTAEAADFLQLKKRTLDNMRWRGEGPKYRKHGGRICYHIDDLQFWSQASSTG